MRRQGTRRSLLIVLTIGLAMGVLLGSGRASPTAAADTAEVDRAAEGERLYRAACSSCHGATGAGAPQSQVAFNTPLPDFTECSFATREPDADWAGIIQEGGPTRAFSHLMPAFGEALSSEEIDLILGYVRSFCDSRSWPRGDLNMPRPLLTEKAFPEDEAVFTSAIATEGLGAVKNKLVYEKRFGVRSQWELIVPFYWLERESSAAEGEAPGTSWDSGLGDVAIGAKSAVWHSLESGSIFSVAGEVILPTGDESQGLGTGVTSLEPFVSFGQLLPASSFLQMQIGSVFPLGGDLANEGFGRLVLGRTFTQGRFGRAWSPMIEIQAARELESGATTHWDAVPQFQVTLSARQHVMLDIGFRQPLDNTDVRDTQILFYLLWDWYDGGLFEGWTSGGRSGRKVDPRRTRSDVSN